MLVDGLRARECDETEEEYNFHSIIETTNLTDADPESVENQPDIDDLAVTAKLESLENKTLILYISIDLENLSVKMVHKSSVLHCLSDPLTFTESCDWLKCVHGYLQYNESTNSSAPESPSVPIPENDDSLYLQDPVLTLVQ